MRSFLWQSYKRSSRLLESLVQGNQYLQFDFWVSCHPNLAIDNIGSMFTDVSSSLTIRREMLETIQHKFPSDAYDDIQWPSIGPEGLLLPRPKKKLGSRLSFDDTPDDDSSMPIKEYWDAIQAKYQSQCLNPSSMSSTQVTELPPNWTVIHINVTEDKNTLFISRQECGENSKGPLMFRVPLKGRRDDGSGTDDDDHLTFESALHGLNEIIRLSNEGTKAAVHIKADDPDARAAWWKERRDLDTRLRELLENIEFCWLGAFKVCSGMSFSGPSSTTIIDYLESTIERRSRSFG
jgi:separase